MTNVSRIAICLGAVVVVLAVAWLLPNGNGPSSRLTEASLDVPIVMHTSGGRLEVATVTNTEGFSLESHVDSVLGTTVSHIQVKAVYRYHIEMAKKWPILLGETVAVVHAGDIRPTLPVAFDTATMRKQTASGWARFDKHDNLAELERLLSPKLASRAMGYRDLAKESARKSVSDFVRKWLIKEDHLPSGKQYAISVLFPGEETQASSAK